MSVARRPERIVLVGFMASGKTTVGRALARRLGWRFADMDERIAERSGRSVGDLFENEGEAFFRQLEEGEARRLGRETALVVASGGGAFAQPETRAALQAGAFTVYLHCDLDELLRRLGDGAGRPLARNRGIIPGLLAAREVAYANADWRIDTTSVDAESVAERIAEALRARAT